MVNTSIKGIGIDAIEIERFRHWHLYKAAQLVKIFTAKELSYCLSNPAKSAERFAARFAAKEALFKALGPSACTSLSFNKLAPLIEVSSTTSGAAILSVAWDKLGLEISQPRVLLSLTHTRTTAIAVVILS